MSYIRYLIEMLPLVEQDTDNIRIAKGKYQEPKTWHEYFKKEWRKKKQ